MSQSLSWTNDDDSKLTLIVGGVVVFVAVLVVFLVTYRSEANATVVSRSWSRSIDIQRYQTVQESDWEVPAGGRETREYSALHHYDHIYTGSTCTGKPEVCTSNYIDVPVYRTKYDYDIDRWITVRTPELHGVGTEATWPDVSDLKDGTALGSERAGTRYSKYTVGFTQGYALDVTEGRWRSYPPGQRVTLILNIFKQALDVK